jgi:hypothetical protein
MVGIKAEDIKDHNAENIMEVTVKTRPERNIMFATKKNIGLQNIIPKTAKPLINDTINNLYIQLKKRLY